MNIIKSETTLPDIDSHEEASLGSNHQHDHSGHGHGHGHDHDNPVISKRWKWATVIGNAAIGTAELIAGNVSTLAVAGDGLHNVGDTITYHMQANGALNPNMSAEKQQRMRKISHRIIATTSLGISIKAGMDLGLNHEDTPHAASLYTAGASLALNGVLLTRLRKGMRAKAHHNAHEQDLKKHFWKVDIPSAALAVTGAGLQKYNVNAEQVLAIASGLFGAWAFRPTAANLSHHCLEHLFGEGDIDPEQHAHTHENTFRWPQVNQKLGKITSCLAFTATAHFGLRTENTNCPPRQQSYQHALARA